MIDPAYRLWAGSGAIMPGRGPYTWHIDDFDQRRRFAVTYQPPEPVEDPEETEEICIKKLRKHIDDLDPGVFGFRFSDSEGPITISTNAEDDTTFCINFHPISMLGLPFPIRTVSIAVLTELDRMGPQVDLVSYPGDPRSDGSKRDKFAFKYWCIENGINYKWHELQCWIRLPRDHAHIVPFDAVVFDNVSGGVVGFTSQYIEGGTLNDNNATKRPFRMKWFQQLLSVVDDLNYRYGVMHQDIAARNLVIDEKDNLRIFDFNFSGIINKNYREEKDDMKGVVHTLHEIITLEEPSREEKSAEELLQSVWTKHPDVKLDSDIQVFRRTLDDWVAKRKARDYKVVDTCLDWPPMPDFPLGEVATGALDGKSQKRCGVVGMLPGGAMYLARLIIDLSAGITTLEAKAHVPSSDGSIIHFHPALDARKQAPTPDPTSRDPDMPVQNPNVAPAVPPPPQPPQPCSQQASLGALPEELLLRIIEFVYGPEVNLDHAYTFSDRHFMFRCLTLVDRRFNRLATPILYRVFATDENPFHEATRIAKTRRFVRSLRANPALIRHIKGICLYVAEMGHSLPAPDAFEIVTELVTLAPNTEFLRVNGGFSGYSKDNWGVIETALDHMSGLNCLNLSRQGWGPTLEEVVRGVQSSQTIERLSLNGVTADTSRTSESIVPEKLYRTAPFTQMQLRDYNENWAATEQLISWPRELQHFKFGNFRNNRNDMDLAMFGEALYQHKDTLRTLDMGFLRRRAHGTRIIDVSLFPALEELTLSRWSFGFEGLRFSGDTGHKLLAPQLRKFTWSFDIGFMESARLSDMGPDEEAWLRDFGTYASRQEDSSLRTIHVHYLPILVLGDQGSSEYPWDRLRRVADYLEPLGIELSYSEAEWSREEWRKCVADWENLK